MALSKYRLGELIESSDIRNSDNEYAITDVKGISIQKVFIETKADMKGVSLKPYKLVLPNYFSYVPVTSRNGNKITLAHNKTTNTYIVSSSYIVFYVKESNKLLSDYLFMYFNRPEFDRYSRFNSWGSARETFDWDELCSMEIGLPSIEIQQKYVDIYNALVANQKSYERGIDDLNLTCDAYLDQLKNSHPGIRIREFINLVDNRNVDNKPYSFKGLSMDNYFIDSIADKTSLDLSKYKIVEPGQFGCVLMKVGRDARITIARNDSYEPYIISSAYHSFCIDGINSDYFMLNVKRSEFERKGWFHCDSSARSSLPWDEFLDLTIPNVSFQEQQVSSNIYKALISRININERLKSQITNICPILVKGSIDEATNNV